MIVIEELIQKSPAEEILPGDEDDEGFVDILLQITSATATGLIDGVETPDFWYKIRR